MSSIVESEDFKRLLERIAADDSSLDVVSLVGGGNEGIRDEGVRRLAEALRGNTSVTELSLGGNGIGPAGARDLSEILSTNSAIKVLYLGMNPIGAEGGRALVEALRTNSTITKLSLTGNRIGAASARLLAEILCTNSAVTELYLSGNSIGEEGARALAEMLRTNSTVTKLDLDRNGIGNGGARALAEMLHANSTLEVLYLMYNDIGDDGARALANTLHTNSAVTSITLGNNGIGDEGGRAFLEALQINCAITCLDIEENIIEEDLEAKVQELYAINRDTPNPQGNHRLKVERRIEWMLKSEDGAEHEAAVSLALAELDSFPEAERRRGLFQCLLGSPGRGADVAASVEADEARKMYWYAAQCGAAPGVLRKLLRAHPTLCTCRDVKHKLFPSMLLATLPEAKVDDVMETLLENPSLVKDGIPVPDEHRASQ